MATITISTTKENHTMTTDNTMTTEQTEQTEPPALILAVLNEEKTIIENLTIAGNGIDLKFIENVLRCNFGAIEEQHRTDNIFLFNFAKNTISDMVEYFIFHSMHSAIATYTGKSVIDECFALHMEKETGIKLSFKKNKKTGCMELFFPHTRKLLMNHKYPFVYIYGLCIHADKCNLNNAVEFRIWLRSELDAIAEELKEIEPGLKSIPDVIRIRRMERTVQIVKDFAARF